MSGRCKGCNSILKETEIRWRPEIHEHEDLCLKCRHQVYDITEEDLEVMDKFEDEGY